MITGSCLCGDVSFEFDEITGPMTHCHCSMCRKAHGAPFATYVSAPRRAFRWRSGEDARVLYQAAPRSELHRAFCPRCGSCVPDVGGDEVSIPAGCLDDDPGVRPSAHIFVESKAPWVDISDALERHEGYGPLSDAAVIERPQPPASPPGVCRGSCLCGKVVFEVTEPFNIVHNCHCRRCRKARAAAHTTNGFVSLEGVRFLSGEDNLVSYKLPEAKFFTHVFCRTCGSGMPRRDTDRGISVVPLGALDEDPGVRAADHIFVRFKAPWYEPTDDLPRYEEGPPSP